MEEDLYAPNSEETYFVSFAFDVMYNLPDDPYSSSIAHGCANVAINCPKFLNADPLTKNDESFSRLYANGAKVSRRRSNEQINAIFGSDLAADFRTPHTLSSQSSLNIGNYH